MGGSSFDLVLDCFSRAEVLPPESQVAFLRNLQVEDFALHARVGALLADRSIADRVFEPPVVERTLTSQGCRRVWDRARNEMSIQFNRFDETVPNEIGPYRELKKIGEGGMGYVLRGKQEQPFRREVALKFVKRRFWDSHDHALSLERECRALALLNNDHIAKVYDFKKTESGQPYLVMELVEGLSLRHYCDEKRLNIKDRVGLFLQVCDGMLHAHQKGVLHGDLKPENVLVSEQNQRMVAKIIDFGIARAADPELQTYLCHRDGKVFGSLAYTSPEQLKGGASDLRADLYALGVLLYELLTGEPMDHFRESAGDKPKAMLYRLINQPHMRLDLYVKYLLGTDNAEKLVDLRGTNPRALLRCVRGDLSQILKKALAKEPKRRYQTVQEFKKDLECWLTYRPVSVVTPSPFYLAERFYRRRKGLASAIGLSVLAVFCVFLALSVGYWNVKKANHAEAQARLAAEAAAEKMEKSFLFLEKMLMNPHAYREGPKVRYLDVIDQGRKDISRYAAGLPELEARLRMALGRMYLSLSMFDDAAAEFRRCLKLNQRVHGPQSLPAAEAMEMLARSLRSGDELPVAESLFRQAILIQEALLGVDHPRLMRSLTGLASLLHRRGDDLKAADLARHARRVLIDALGPSDSSTLQATHTLANALMSRGHYDQALVLFEESVSVKTVVFGEDHPETILSLHHLAGAWRRLGRLEKAERFYRKAAGLREQWFSTTHPRRLNSLYGLANVMIDQNRFQETIELSGFVLKHRREQLGDGDCQTLEAQFLYGCALGQGGEPGAAVEILGQLLTRYQIRGESETRQTLRVMNNLGHFLIRIGDHAEAIPLLEKTLSLKSVQIGEDHPNYSLTLATLGEALLGLGCYEEAADRFLKANEVSSRHLPIGRSAHFFYKACYGYCLLKMERYEQAEQKLVAGFNEIAPNSKFKQPAAGYLDEFYAQDNMAQAPTHRTYRGGGD